MQLKKLIGISLTGLIIQPALAAGPIGCFGSEIKTPNLDKLAQKGVRFSQFYNAARCCPTRASLLTGLYQHQAGVGDMVNDLGYPWYTCRANGM